MIEGLLGAQLLNLSAAVALRMIRAQSDDYSVSPRILDWLLMPTGAFAGFLAMFWFLNHMGLLAPILWLLSCLAFVMGVWPVEERTRSLLGLVSLIAGALLLFASSTGVSRHPDCPPPRMYSFCLGCTC